MHPIYEILLAQHPENIRTSLHPLTLRSKLGERLPPSGVTCISCHKLGRSVLANAYDLVNLSTFHHRLSFHNIRTLIVLPCVGHAEPDVLRR